jgi:hypothetical protein
MVPQREAVAYDAAAHHEHGQGTYHGQAAHQLWGKGQQLLADFALALRI